MPSVINVDRNIIPNVIKLKRSEVKKLIPMLEMLKRGDLGQVDINDSTQTLSIRLGWRNSALDKKLSLTIADTTLAQNFTIRIAKHSFIHFLNALRQWGDAVSSFTFDANNQVGFTPTIRFLLAAGS